MKTLPLLPKLSLITTALLTLFYFTCLPSCTTFFERLDDSALAQKAGLVGDNVLIWALATDRIDADLARSIYGAKTLAFDPTLTPEARQAEFLKTLTREAVAKGVISQEDLLLFEAAKLIVLPDKAVAPDGKTVVPVLPAEPVPLTSLRPAPIFGNEPGGGLLAYSAQF